MAFRRALKLPKIAVLVGLSVGVGCQDSAQKSSRTYEVVRGDTLSAIARREGVSVQDLMRWNDLRTDRIEVGRVLTIESVAVKQQSSARAQSKVRQRRSVRESTEKRPKARPCLKGPSLDDLDNDDVEIRGSMGLNIDQLRAAMGPAIAKMGGCIQGEWPSAIVMTEITVSCSGLVERVHVLDDGGVDSMVLECVSSVLHRQGFPPHDMPDGFSFQYPIAFSP